MPTRRLPMLGGRLSKNMDKAFKTSMLPENQQSPARQLGKAWRSSTSGVGLWQVWQGL